MPVRPGIWRELMRKVPCQSMTSPEKLTVLGATRDEIFRVFHIARRRKMPIHVHVNSMRPGEAGIDLTTEADPCTAASSFLATTMTTFHD